MRFVAVLAAALLLLGLGLLVTASSMDTSVTTSDRNLTQFWAEAVLVAGGSLAAAVALTFGLWRRYGRRRGGGW